MNFQNPNPAQTKKRLPAATRPKIPRLRSLLHRLQRAKDAAGQPIPLLDELLFFLEDPPQGTGDRWQAGADLCATHGIETSRMAVYRLFCAHILQWRRAQNPPPPASLSPEETARLHDQATHLAAQRSLEMLNDPRLSPSHLIGLVQNDNQRRSIQLARDQFDDRLALRRSLEKQRYFQTIDNEIRDKTISDARMKMFQKILNTHGAVPPHTTL